MPFDGLKRPEDAEDAKGLHGAKIFTSGASPGKKGKKKITMRSPLNANTHIGKARVTQNRVPNFLPS